MHLLQSDKINVYYGDIRALKDVDFHIDEAEIVSILGSNAAGKTTIMRTISGLLPIKSGFITFRGEKTNQLNPHQIVEKGIVHVPEGREIFPSMTILENLEMGAHVAHARKNWKQRVEEIYDLFPILKDRQKRFASNLSGGERQMLAIGRGLMAKPVLLMLDEPSLGLAPLAVKHIFEIVVTINNNGLTILLVEQNVSNALEISNRAYILENGAIINQGKGKELLQNDQIRKAYLGM